MQSFTLHGPMHGMLCHFEHGMNSRNIAAETAKIVAKVVNKSHCRWPQGCRHLSTRKVVSDDAACKIDKLASNDIESSSISDLRQHQPGRPKDSAAA